MKGRNPLFTLGLTRPTFAATNPEFLNAMARHHCRPGRTNSSFSQISQNNVQVDRAIDGWVDQALNRTLAHPSSIDQRAVTRTSLLLIVFGFLGNADSNSETC